MSRQAVERHIYCNGTQEKQRENIRGKFAKKNFVPQIRPRPSIECAEIEHSIDTSTHYYICSKQKTRAVSSHTMCMLAFHGGSIQCIGMRNGSIAIGDWLNEDRHRTYKVASMDPKAIEDNKRCVKSLLYFNGFIMTGLLDGAVLFFSVLQSRVVQREFYHRSQVVFLGNSLNNHLVSVCQDGHVVIYLLENRILVRQGKKMFPILHEHHFDVRISAGYISEDHLILGTEDGFLEIVNIPHLKKVCSAIGICEKEFKITSLWKSSYTLVIGTSDGKIRIFEVTKGTDKMGILLSKILHYHKAAIVRLYCDEFAMNFWSADESGIVISWDKSPVTSHKILSYHRIGEPIRDIAFTEVTHSTALWTTSTCGKNMLYWTTVNNAQKEVDDAIKCIDSELESKQGDLQNGFSSIDDVEKIEEHVYRRLPHLSGLIRRRQTLGYYFRRWGRFIHVRTKINRLKTSMGILERKNHEKQRLNAWSALIRHIYICKHKVMETKFQSLKKTIQFRSTVIGHYDAWHRWYQERNKKITQLKKSLEKMSSRYLRCSLLPSYKSLLSHAKIERSSRSKIILFQSLLKKTHQQILRGRFYANLNMCRIKRERIQKLEVLSMKLLCKNKNEISISCMEKIKAFHSYCCRKSLMHLVAHSLIRQRERIMLRKIYEIFSVSQIRYARRNINENRASLLKTLDGLRDEAGILHEKNSNILLHESLLQELRQLEKTCAAHLEKMESLRASNEQIDHDIAHAQKERPKFQVTEELVETMSFLKCRALNFDSDYVLIQKTVDRANFLGSHGAIRIFLSAHLDIKRILVSFLGEQPKKKNSDDHTTNLTYTWGATRNSIMMALKKFPNHTHACLLDAIKRMVVAFDMLLPKDLSSIDIDDEIVANGSGLVTMYELLAEQRTKKNISRVR